MQFVRDQYSACSIRYGDMKKQLAEDIVQFLAPIRERYDEIYNDDAYLHRGYDGNYVYAGSIFLEAQNTPDFLDGNSIIYGHNMKDGTMFNCLEEWADQAYYEAHPTVWLLTPTQDYKINLFSCHLTDARSGCYVTGFADETAR